MLTVLGYPAADEREAERRLKALEDAELVRPLPPVAVVKASAGRIEVPVSFRRQRRPAALAHRRGRRCARA